MANPLSRNTTRGYRYSSLGAIFAKCLFCVKFIAFVIVAHSFLFFVEATSETWNILLLF